MKNEKPSFYNKISFLILLIPISYWLFILQKYAVNVPWFDDFDPFPDFLRHWIVTSDPLSRLKLIFQPNNEHRMIWGKISTLAYYWTTGALNFRFLQFASAGFTLGTLVLFWLSFRRLRLPLWYFIPVAFFIFHIQYYGTFLWSICGMQHQPVIFFVALSCYLLGNNNFGWAILAAVCANFAMSNGIFVWVSGAAILLFSDKRQRLAIWVVLGAICVALYFRGMSAQGNENSFSFLAKYPLKSVVGFFTFLGGLFDLSPDKKIEIRNIPTFLGGIIAGTYALVYAVTKTFRLRLSHSYKSESSPSTAFFLGIIIFILSNAAVIALLRPRFGMDVMLASNYKIYPGVFFAAAYCSLLLTDSVRQIAGKMGVGIAIIIWTGSLLIYLPTIRERSYYLTINAFNQKNNEFGLGFEAGSDAAKYIADLMDFLAKKDVYHLPELPVGKHLAGHQILESEKPVENVLTVTPTHVRIFMPQLSVPTQGTGLRYFFLQSEQKLYLIPVTQHLNGGRNPFRKFDTGASAEIQKSILRPDMYTVGLYAGSEKSVFFLDKIVVSSH